MNLINPFFVASPPVMAPVGWRDIMRSARAQVRGDHLWFHLLALGLVFSNGFGKCDPGISAAHFGRDTFVRRDSMLLLVRDATERKLDFFIVLMVE